MHVPGLALLAVLLPSQQQLLEGCVSCTTAGRSSCQADASLPTLLLSICVTPSAGQVRAHDGGELQAVAGGAPGQLCAGAARLPRAVHEPRVGENPSAEITAVCSLEATMC